MTIDNMTGEQRRDQVRSRYAEAATRVLETGTGASGGDGCCGPGRSCGGPDAVEVDDNFGSALYSAGERGELPVAAVAASLGCGNPTALAHLRAGERVL